MMVHLSITQAAAVIFTVFSGALSRGIGAFAFAIDARPAASILSKNIHQQNGGARNCLVYDASYTRYNMRPIVRGGALKLSADSNTREDALASMKTCSRTLFAAAIVDTLTRLMPYTRGGWKVMLESRPSSWLDIADVVADVNLVAFGIGLWWVSKLYEKIAADNNDKVDMSVVANIFRSYNIMYLATGWSMMALSIRLASKVFVFNTYAPLSVLILTLFVSIFMSATFIAKKESNPDNMAMIHGLKAARSMSFCSVSFLIFAVLRLFFWGMVVMPGHLSIVIKILQVNKFLTPLALTKLLQSLNSNFTNATREVTKTTNIEKSQVNVDVFRELKEAESGFYDKMASVLRSSLILDIIRYGLPIVQGPIAK